MSLRSCLDKHTSASPHLWSFLSLKNDLMSTCSAADHDKKILLIRAKGRALNRFTSALKKTHRVTSNFNNSTTQSMQNLQTRTKAKALSTLNPFALLWTIMIVLQEPDLDRSFGSKCTPDPFITGAVTGMPMPQATAPATNSSIYLKAATMPTP